MAYNPGIQYRGDQHLAAGISGAANALADGLATWQQNRQEGQYLDAQAARLAETMAQLAQSSGGPPPDPKLIEELAGFPGLSLGQKRGKLAGIMFQADQMQRQATAMAEEARHRERMGIEMGNLELRRGELLRRDAESRASAEAEAARQRDTLGMLLGLNQVPGDTAATDDPLAAMIGPVDQRRTGEALQSQFPNADPKIVAPWLRESASRDRRPMETSIAGRPVAYSPHTGQFQVIPAGPSEGDIQAMPVIDEAGNVIGHGIPSGRGGIQFRASRPEVPKDGTPVPGLENSHVYVNGRAVQKSLAATILGGGPAAGAAPGPPVKKYDPATRRVQ